MCDHIGRDIPSLSIFVQEAVYQKKTSLSKSGNKRGNKQNPYYYIFIAPFAAEFILFQKSPN